MTDKPQGPMQINSGSAWAIAVAALFIGYLWGEHSGSTQLTSAQSSPTQTVTAPTTPQGSAADTNTSLATNTSAAPIVSTAPSQTSPNTSTTVLGPYPQVASSGQSSVRDNGNDVQTASADVVTASSTNASETSADGSPFATTHSAPTSSDVPPATSSTYVPTSSCTESGSCYGDISNITGLPKTTYVHGYFRKNGTYVGSYYRSHH